MSCSCSADRSTIHITTVASNTDGCLDLTRVRALMNPTRSIRSYVSAGALHEAYRAHHHAGVRRARAHSWPVSADRPAVVEHDLWFELHRLPEMTSSVARPSRVMSRAIRSRADRPGRAEVGIVCHCYRSSDVSAESWGGDVVPVLNIPWVRSTTASWLGGPEAVR